MSAEMWTGLAERAEKATGPDRELDAFVELQFRPLGWVAREAWVAEDDRYFRTHFPPKYMTRKCTVAKRYTASVDICLELIAETLPGWTRYVDELRTDRWFGGLRNAEDTDRGLGYRGDLSAYAATPALALLAALCRALAAQAEAGGVHHG